MKGKMEKLFKEPILYILILCIILQCIMYKYSTKISIYPDSSGYVNYEYNIFQGKVQSQRPPIYPYIIKAIKIIGGENNLYQNIVYIQYILMYISIIFFYLSIKQITKNKVMIIVATLIYGICPYIFLWNNVILTESVSIVAVTILMYLTISYIKKPNKILAVLLGISSFLLVMIKPAFIYVTVLYLVFWILKILLDREERKISLIGLIFTVVSIALILIYCMLIKLNHGVFNITTVSETNRLISILESKIYENNTNKRILQTIKEQGEDTNKFIIKSKLKEEYSHEELKQFMDEAVKNNKIEYLKYIIKKTVSLKELPVGTTYVDSTVLYNNNNIFQELGYIIFPITFMHVYILIMGCIIYLIYDLIRNRNINYILSFFTLMILANFFTAIVGAPYETTRLVCTSIPIIIVLLVYIVNSLISKKCN